jgi:hypothetical protein
MTRAGPARVAVRLYPVAWRVRYGAEFEQQLLDEIADSPPSRGVTLHIAPGCHDGAFLNQQQLPSLLLLGRHLTDAHSVR